ncbi:MAG: hypothetical protein ABIH26_12750 [Candidatus Eisenbacteria bacterium]
MNRQDLVTRIEIKDRNGRVVGTKEVVKYPGLLSRAHDEGLKRIETTIAQLPTEANGMSAVVRAQVETGKGTFTGTGEASPGNTNSRVGSYLVHMAETRAKGRALRDAVNIGVVSLEEILGDGQDFLPEEAALSENKRGATPAPARSGGSESLMTEAQRRYLFRLLADQGIRGDAAHAYLQEAFGTESLKEVTKERASALIEELLGENRS